MSEYIHNMNKTKKMKMIILIGCIAFLGLAAYFAWKTAHGKTADDAVRFAEEYTQVTEDNVFVYRSVEEILDLMRSGTGIVYLGYPECVSCQCPAVIAFR